MTLWVAAASASYPSRRSLSSGPVRGSEMPNSAHKAFITRPNSSIDMSMVARSGDTDTIFIASSISYPWAVSYRVGGRRVSTGVRWDRPPLALTVVDYTGLGPIVALGLSSMVVVGLLIVLLAVLRRGARGTAAEPYVWHIFAAIVAAFVLFGVGLMVLTLDR